MSNIRLISLYWILFNHKCSISNRLHWSHSLLSSSFLRVSRTRLCESICQHVKYDFHRRGSNCILGSPSLIYRCSDLTSDVLNNAAERLNSCVESLVVIYIRPHVTVSSKWEARIWTYRSQSNPSLFRAFRTSRRMRYSLSLMNFRREEIGRVGQGWTAMTVSIILKE